MTGVELRPVRGPQMLAALVVFAGRRGVVIRPFLGVVSGPYVVDLDDPFAVLDLMLAFYEQQPATAKKKPRNDALLLQCSPGSPTAPPEINITRQIYGGAGRSTQLGISLVYGALPRLKGQHITQWSFDLDDDVDFGSVCATLIASLGKLAKPKKCHATLDFF